jgi:hypothetical protein
LETPAKTKTAFPRKDAAADPTQKIRSWDDLFLLVRGLDVPADFLSNRLDDPPQKRTLF